MKLERGRRLRGRGGEKEECRERVEGVERKEDG